MYFTGLCIRPVDVLREESRAPYGGNRFAYFDGETPERDFGNNETYEDNMRLEQNRRLSVYSLDCNVNRGSFAIIVHYTRAWFCLSEKKKRKTFSLSIPNQGSTYVNRLRQVWSTIRVAEYNARLYSLSLPFLWVCNGSDADLRRFRHIECN